VTDAVVFDLDGVLVQSEEVWDAARRELVEQAGRTWPDTATRDMMGMSSLEWSREIVELVIEQGDLEFAATVSSEEVARGKPAPDVYLEAARRLDVAADRCAAVEDSTNGLLSAQAAGMLVVAIPNPAFPPEPRGLRAASVVLDSICELSPETILAAAPRRSA
jgi:beta-phosphoglucomutase-like phosphatase (HAD superfamily)